MYGSGVGVMDSLNHGVWCCRYLCNVHVDKHLSLHVLGASSLALWMRDVDSDQGSEMET